MDQGPEGQIGCGEITAVIVRAGRIRTLEDFDQVGEADFREKEKRVVGIGFAEDPSLPAMPGKRHGHSGGKNGDGEMQFASLEFHAEP